MMKGTDGQAKPEGFFFEMAMNLSAPIISPSANDSKESPLQAQSFQKEKKVIKRALEVKEKELGKQNLKRKKYAIWKPRNLKIDTAMQKMLRNSRKAIEEHKEEDFLAYASYQSCLPILEDNLPTAPALSLEYVSAEAQGRRPRMEDVHLFQEILQGALVGVFDGHGGQQVAEQAKEEFEKNFSETLALNKGNVHLTFEQLIDEIHQNIIQHTYYDMIGTTLAISFIDKNTHLIYTATLGDTEANIYRNKESIALSCVRNWTHAKEAARAAIALEDPTLAETWPLAKNPKTLRYPNSRIGLNVSRAIGDKYASGKPDKPAVIHKPKITVNRLRKGDILIIACDGLKDYVLENEIIAHVTSEPQEKEEEEPLVDLENTEEEEIEEEKASWNNSPKNLAQRLVDYALEKNSADNVTVVVVKIH
ncbi:PP2C family serine/threonine-protein phosphatase [Neochlamydia sp. S13]|uniref:PP2C family serine/threonine-protein phosphatase n=1 Tax=Neochlamydia sp. S13 TaxID=1353976 RepID=UPI000693A1DA|nr:PP2C family protein-serine/threonine phosphatase [Neochlamydia sp. S13]BBI17483.1 Uncharacterized protein NCS13_1_1288 [Neochlamydia sp. S13]